MTEIWTYLSSQPLLWLVMTLGAYLIGDWIFMKSGRFPLFNPMVLAIVFLGAALLATHTPYKTYFQGAQFIHFLLGPATVGLAVPLFSNIHHVKRSALPLAISLVVGCFVAVGSALITAKLLGLSGQTLISLAPKSVTAPVAIGISERIGGLPSLTAAMVVITGVVGSVMASYIFNALRIRDWRARGFAIGVAAHGLGTARALQVHGTAGAFAGVGLALNGLLTCFVAPYLVSLFQ